MANFWDTIGVTNNGQLPTVNVQVEVDNNSIYKLAGAIGGITLIVGLILIIVSKYAHKN